MTVTRGQMWGQSGGMGQVGRVSSQSSWRRLGSHAEGPHGAILTLPVHWAKLRLCSEGSGHSSCTMAPWELHVLMSDSFPTFRSVL